MDTTTVNYGIEKLGTALDSAISKVSAGWTAVAPQVADVSEKYVSFVVMKTVLIPFIFIVPMIISAMLLKKGSTIYKARESKYDEIYLPFVIFGTIIGCISLVFFCGFSYDAILAITCPEMFTIHQLLGK